MATDRPAIFNYIASRFGRTKTARVSAFGTAQSKETIDLIGRYLARKWYVDNGYIKSTDKQSAVNSLPDDVKRQNPYSVAAMKKIKSEFSSDEEAARKAHPEIFYYFEGICGMKVSQSVHPAGMVISPITLNDNYGIFEKDGDMCLMFDMDAAHDTGLAKYDLINRSSI